MNRRTRRRTLLGAMGAGLAVPQLVFAQAAKPATVAVLFAGDSEDDEPAARPFFDAMARFGWVEGKTVVYDRHSGKGVPQYLDTVATAAAGREPTLIYAIGASLAKAVLGKTDVLPVVFITYLEPVAAGMVASLAKPGRNATGVFQVLGDAAARRFQLVSEAMPGLKRMGAVFDRGAQEYLSRKSAHEKAARAAGLELVSAEFTNFEALEKILVRFRRDGLTAAEITPSFSLIGRRREVVRWAGRNGIALVAHRVEWVDAGAVMSYGVDSGEGHRVAAKLIDRILKGAIPSEVPVERVQKFELAFNSAAAAALSLRIPASVLKRAHKVIK